MQNIKCLVVEDEPLAAEVLEDYITQVPHLQLISTCGDAIAALEVLQTKTIDLIFLDIHLPKLKGIDFLKTLQHPPKIIITSAYEQYALQGYELDVVDYLLKPIEFARFLTAVNKAAAPVKQPADRPFVFFNVGKKRVKVWLEDILYIESVKEYIKIVTHNQSILTKLSLSETEAVLNSAGFLRIHRSYIVATDKIDAFTATDVHIKDKLIPIGRSYREHVYAQLEKGI